MPVLMGRAIEIRSGEQFSRSESHATEFGVILRANKIVDCWMFTCETLSPLLELENIECAQIIVAGEALFSSATSTGRLLP